MTDNCAICGKDVDAGVKPQAHWGGNGDSVIVAWTCSPSCTTTYIERNAR